MQSQSENAEPTVVSGGGPLPLAEDGFQAGQRLGRYHILETVGRGGMGRVYRAYDPKLRREVALKVLHQAAHAQGGADSLLAEAQAMARLSHPNIVPVHDIEQVGTSVFLSMEFVDGSTLGKWLEATSPSQREILGIFLAAGRGLAAAHAAALVHRDFKPANVLVGDALGNETKRVLVTDFGLAAERGRPPSQSDIGATGPDDDVTIFTSKRGVVAGTPAYMSPEQHAGETLDARTDQYSFCVALYEALYGTRPFPQRELTTLAAAKLHGPSIDPPSKGRAGGVPRRIHRALMRGLRPKPDDRFENMEALLRELGPPSQRRPMGWAGVGLLGVGAVVLGIAAWSKDRPCQDGRARLSGAWDESRRAEVERVVLETDLPYAGDATHRITDALDAHAQQWVEGWVDACQAAHHKEQSDRLLDLRMACLSAHRRELEALVQTLTELDSSSLDDAVSAVWKLGTVQECADTERLLRRTDPPPAEIATEVDRVRGELARVRSLGRLGRQHDAAELLERVVAEAEQIDYPPLSTEARFEAGRQAIRGRRSAAAREAMKAAYFGAVSHGEHELAIRSAAELAYIYGDIAVELERGREWQHHAEALLAAYGDPPSLRAGLLNNICVMEIRAADFESAVEHCTSALRLHEEVSGPDHPNVVGPLNNLAKLEVDRGHPKAAEPYAARALEVSEKAYGSEHPVIADRLNVQGSILGSQDQDEQAGELFARALHILRAAGAEDGQLLPALTNLAVTHAKSEDFDRAKELFEEAAEIRAEIQGPNHPEVALDYGNLAALETDRGNFDAAKVYAEKALRICQDTYGLQHPLTAESMYRLAMSYYKQDRFDEARPLLRTLYDEVQPDKIRPHTRAFVGSYLARLDTREGHLDEAAAMLAEFDDRAHEDPAVGRVYASTHLDLARAERDAGRDEQARARAKAALVHANEILETSPDEALRDLVQEIETFLGQAIVRPPSTSSTRPLK